METQQGQQEGCIDCYALNTIVMTIIICSLLIAVKKLIVKYKALFRAIEGAELVFKPCSGSLNWNI